MLRREFFKFLTMGAAGLVIDPELELWVPGAKKIFIMDVPRGMSTSEIIAIELERIVPRIRDLFERDDLFYSAIKTKDVVVATESQMRIPLIVEK